MSDLVGDGGSEDGRDGLVAVAGGGDGLRVGDGGIGGVDDGEAGGSGRGAVEDFHGEAGGGPYESDAGLGEDGGGHGLGAGEGVGGRGGGGEVDREGHLEEEHAMILGEIGAYLDTPARTNGSRSGHGAKSFFIGVHRRPSPAQFRLQRPRKENSAADARRCTPITQSNWRLARRDRSEIAASKWLLS